MSVRTSLAEPSQAGDDADRAVGAPGTAPPRVAFCIDNMNVGGTELNALRTARHLRDRGVPLSVFCLSSEGPLLERYAELGVPVDLLPLTKLYGRNALACGRRLAAIVRERGIQVVHAHDFYSNIFAAPWARLAGAAFIASRRWWEGPERRSQRWANRASYLLAHRVLANSPSVGDLLVRGEWLRRSRTIIIPNFLDEKAFELPPESWVEAECEALKLPRERIVIGTVASLSPIKDHASLLRAFALLAPAWPRAYLVLVGGDGGSRTSLESLAADLSLQERVRFAGLRPSMPSPHHWFDVSTLTSLSEGLPNSLLEAMAAGRPVVATRVGAIPDAVLDGTTGLLVPARSPTAIAEAVTTILQDPLKGRRFGSEGRLRAHALYSAGEVMDRLERLYRALTLHELV